MNNTYKFTVSCSNCGIDELVDWPTRSLRPAKKECTNCGCMADTHPTVFNKNIIFDFKPPVFQKPLINPMDDKLIC